MGKKSEPLYNQCYLREDVDIDVAFAALCADFGALTTWRVPREYTPGGADYRFSTRGRVTASMVPDAQVKIALYPHKDGDFLAVNLIPQELTTRDAHKISPLQEILARHRFEPCSDQAMYDRWHTGRPKLE